MLLRIVTLVIFEHALIGFPCELMLILIDIIDLSVYFVRWNMVDKSVWLFASSVSLGAFNLGFGLCKMNFLLVLDQ